MQIDRHITKPIIESVPATELHYRCDEGYRLARKYESNVSFGGIGYGAVPTYDVHIKGAGYNYTDDSDGHTKDDSLTCIEQTQGSGNDHPGP